MARHGRAFPSRGVLLRHVATGGGASVTVNAAVLTGTFAVVAPVVRGAAQVSPTALTGTFSLVAPVVRGNASVSPAHFTLTLALPSVVVSAGGNVTVSVTPLSGTFALPAAVAHAGAVVSASALTGTFTLVAPTVSVVANITVAPAPLTLTLTLGTARVSLGAQGIVLQIQTLLQDTNVFWPNQTVLDAVNEAQFWVFSETKWALTSATLTVSANADIVTVPSAVLIPTWIEGTNTTVTPHAVTRVPITTQRNLENYIRTWKGAPQGAPTNFIMWDATHLRLFPRPDGVYNYTVFGVGFPTEITSVNDEITGPALYVIRSYALSLLLEATRPDLADVYMKQAQDAMLAFKKRLRNQMSHNIRTLTPATTQFQLKQGGEMPPSNCLKDYIG